MVMTRSQELARGSRDGWEWARDYATPEELDYFTTEYDGSGGDIQGDHSLLSFFTKVNRNICISVRVNFDDPYWDAFLNAATRYGRAS